MKNNFKTLWEEGTYIFSKIVNRNYDFEMGEEIENIEYKQFARYFDGMFSSTISGKLSIQIWSDTSDFELRV